MNWKHVYGRLIRRGELLLGIDFLEECELELSLLNDCKVGRLFNITDGYTEFLTVICYLFYMPYR
jgi:hypothetical protein